MDLFHLNRTASQFVILAGDNIFTMLHGEIEGKFPFLGVEI
jgi:hypothetical protein